MQNTKEQSMQIVVQKLEALLTIKRDPNNPELAEMEAEKICMALNQLNDNDLPQNLENFPAIKALLNKQRTTTPIGASVASLLIYSASGQQFVAKHLEWFKDCEMNVFIQDGPGMGVTLAYRFILHPETSALFLKYPEVFKRCGLNPALATGPNAGVTFAQALALLEHNFSLFMSIPPARLLRNDFSLFFLNLPNTDDLQSTILDKLYQNPHQHAHKLFNYLVYLGLPLITCTRMSLKEKQAVLEKKKQFEESVQTYLLETQGAYSEGMKNKFLRQLVQFCPEFAQINTLSQVNFTKEFFKVYENKIEFQQNKGSMLSITQLQQLQVLTEKFKVLLELQGDERYVVTQMRNIFKELNQLNELPTTLEQFSPIKNCLNQKRVIPPFSGASIALLSTLEMEGQQFFANRLGWFKECDMNAEVMDGPLAGVTLGLRVLTCLKIWPLFQKYPYLLERCNLAAAALRIGSDRGVTLVQFLALVPSAFQLFIFLKLEKIVVKGSFTESTDVRKLGSRLN